MSDLPSPWPQDFHTSLKALERSGKEGVAPKYTGTWPNRIYAMALYIASDCPDVPESYRIIWALIEGMADENDRLVNECNRIAEQHEEELKLVIEAHKEDRALQKDINFGRAYGSTGKLKSPQLQQVLKPKLLYEDEK